MRELNFTNSSYVLYQILPDHKKIDFLNKSLETDSDIGRLTKEVYQSHFKEVISSVGQTEIGIISYMTQTNDKVIVFFHEDMMHVNCDKLIPIRELVRIAMMEGNILVKDNDFKKTPENRDRYHLRYYRAYRRINHEGMMLPLCLT